MSRPVRRVALFGYLGSGNLGNDASFETVLGWLRTTQPDIEVRGVTTAPDELTARYGVPAVSLAWRSSRTADNRIKEASRKLLGRLLDVPRSYKLAGSVDAVIVPGMGVLEATLGVRPWGMPLWLFLAAAACRLRRRRFVLLDVGAEWAKNPFTRLLNVATVGLATHVSYRDQGSAAAMARAGARDPEAVAPDLVFAHPAPNEARPELGRVVAGVTAFYGPGDNPVRGAEVRRRCVAAMADALAQITDDGAQVVIVGGDRVDMDVAHEVRAAILTARPGLPDDAAVVREFTTFTELTEEMMRAEVVIASRFHNLICALRLARPTVSAGYAKKNHYLMETLGLEAYSRNLKEVDASWLVAQVRAAREHAGSLTNQIWRGTSQYADEVESLLRQVAGDALGLTPRPWRRPYAHDEIDAWHGV
jgi:polysaccharide pyruvyl transferase WcaK-like protein